jgi:formate dehydrogenase assembly factor FdhD
VNRSGNRKEARAHKSRRDIKKNGRKLFKYESGRINCDLIIKCVTSSIPHCISLSFMAHLVS